MSWIALWIFLAGNLSAQATADAEDIRGPKPLIEIPQSEKSPVTLWLSLGASALLLGIAVALWRKQSGKQKLKTPRELALSALTQLEIKSDELSAEMFANNAAQTVRQYIAGRFGIAAPRRTTEEFFEALAQSKDSPLISESQHLQQFLKSCDLAKFAASQLNTKDRVELIQAARDFITTTANPSPNH
ncbi:MAG: DUF4381 family protein [Akkermansiaceae bacterium]|nr:DUF4381 family protein [Akkermansiaceae bacterium]